MRTLKVLFPILFGITTTAAVMMGFSHQEIAFAAPNAATYYVDVDAPGTGSGLDWTNAFTNLQDALAWAIERPGASRT